MMLKKPYLLLACLMPSAAFASDGVTPEMQYILNSLLFLISGFLVMFMAAGFTMLEAGMVRSTSVATICIKNMAIYAVAGLAYYLIGYHLMYTGVDGGWAGVLRIWEVDDSEALSLTGSFTGEGGYSSAAGWFFQMVFVATAASIVSGTVAERIKMWPFLIFAALLSGLIYPVAGSWLWGEGWLYGMGFKDFAGGTLVHSLGGWAALIGLLLIGPRKGRFTKTGKPLPMPGSSIPLATLGTFILWLGWLGFNGGSQLAMGSAADIANISIIFVNTNAAAAAGVLAAMLITQIRFKKIDPSITLNGALAGLVSITAEPLTPTLGEAALIGAAGATLMAFAVPLLDRLKLDDVVGAIPVHLVCGIWGTLAVAFTNPDASFTAQLIGIVAVGAYACLASLVLWAIVQKLFGLRISLEQEEAGMDQAEFGLDAYPEFVRTRKL